MVTFIPPLQILSMNKQYDEEIRARVIGVLHAEPVASIQEVAMKAKTMRVTAKKHLERLVKEDLVIELKKGPARLFMLKGCDTR
jgi:predicted ArsR family transcriptional regulator